MRAKARPNGKFLTLRQAEIELGIPYGLLRHWVVSGLIRRIDPDVTGRSYLILRSDLDQFIDNNLTETQS
jgi:hypothetical protein